VAAGLCSLGEGLELSLLAEMSLASAMVDGRFVTVLEAGAWRETVSFALSCSFSLFWTDGFCAAAVVPCTSVLSAFGAPLLTDWLSNALLTFPTPLF
jgi:hypothetical protein